MSDVENVIPDPREARLPAWAREKMGRLRTAARSAEASRDDAIAENDRLRGLIDRHNDRGTADTFLLTDDAEVPLGKGVTIRFSDFYEVRFDASGSRLEIEGDKDIAIRPADSYLVAVLRA